MTHDYSFRDVEVLLSKAYKQHIETFIDILKTADDMLKPHAYLRKQTERLEQKLNEL